MEPISRRLFLVGGVAVIVGACSSGGDAPSSSELPLGPLPTGGSTATDGTPDTGPVDTGPVDTGTAGTPLPDPDDVVLASDPFTLGVASGDPTPTSVVLWTRLAPDPSIDGGGMPDGDVEVVWEMATGDAFDTIAATGVTVAEARYAHSVHVVVTLDRDDPTIADALAAGSVRYRFRAGGHTSPIGRTTLAPGADDGAEQCRFVSASCQHYESGYYLAHRDIAEQSPDFVVWLGDYIYEGGAGTVGDGNVRSHGTPEVTSLDQYRARYALYKADPDLQAAHASCPWMVTWDDHEVENNYAGLVPQSDADAATFAQRRHEAYQAWWEHQPVALPPPVAGDDYPIYRAFTWGSLITVAVLDGRQYRSDQTCGGETLNLDPPCPETFDETRSMLGDAQEQWLFDVLNVSTSTWNVIAQQTVFGDVTLGGAVLNYDQWDGYPVQRNRIVDRLAADEIANVVVLTGDIHFAGTGIIRSGGRGTGIPVGTEFVATSISSGGRIDPAVTDVVRAIPDIVDVELEHRGYILHTVGAPAWDAQYRMLDTVKEPTSAVYQHARYRVESGTNLVTIAQGLSRE